MQTSTTVPETGNAQPDPVAIPVHLPTRKDGCLKSRLSWKDKLTILDPYSEQSATESRLINFTNLFAYRTSRAIVTKVNGDHRSWTELKHKSPELPHIASHPGGARAAPILTYVARHLIGARAAPILSPQWVGARSYRTTLYFCIDVDRGHGSRTGRRPFHERCHQVEKALRRMGIDPADPMQVLIVPSPSGGRHYYVFFDAPHLLDQFHGLLDAGGLRHEDGEIEYFPSENKGLRLPFGHIPDRPHHPADWIQFIDDYRNGRIRRHSLEVLHTRLSRPGRASSAPPSRPMEVASDCPPGKVLPGLGLPKHLRLPQKEGQDAQPAPNAETGRYQQFLDDGVHSIGEAEELFRMGILLRGTRNSVLKMLAAHLIWFRHLAEEKATEFLTRWALDRRHNSKDIKYDLDHGTSRVADQIRYLCRWCVRKKKSMPTASRSVEEHALFARAELTPLRLSIESLIPEARLSQAQFLLHFLGYAKKNGWAADDDSGWEAAVSIKKVVKSWPGCGSKNYYKVRMNLAQEAGLFAMVREKWQNPHGAGRARTYRLSVPVVDRSQWTFGYPEALAILTGDTVGDEDADRTHEHRVTGTGHMTDEPSDRSHPGQAPSPAADPRPLHPGGPGGHLGPGPHQRHPEQAPVEELPDSGPGTGPASPSPPAGIRVGLGRWPGPRLGSMPWRDAPRLPIHPVRIGTLPEKPSTPSQDKAIDLLREEYLATARQRTSSQPSDSPDRGDESTSSGRGTDTGRGP